MINQEKNKLRPSNIQKTRMRYRGPIESIKINNFQKSIQKDIIKLNEDVALSRNSLHQYLNEILKGSSQKIEIMESESPVYMCEDNIPIHEMLSDNMIREGFEEHETILWEL